MATISLRGTPATTCGELPATGTVAPNFFLVGVDMAEFGVKDFPGKNVILNVFPSIDTPTCQRSVRAFNEKAASLENAVVICVSADLPFAQKRFCGVEGLEHVVTGSTFRSPEFGEDFGLTFLNERLQGLLARAVVVINPDGKIIHSQLVEEISHEPDYEAVLSAL